MELLCASFDELSKRIRRESVKIVMFGAGAIGQVVAPQIINDQGLLDRVDCYIDNNESRWGEEISVCGRSFEIRAVKYLDTCPLNTVILVNISRFFDAIEQLKGMECTQNMCCYIMPMMLIHNYCLSASTGHPVMADDPVIPKKIHYMWLGGNPLPDKLKRCIDSWEKYCPDYEIIEWNENNYDIGRHKYMSQAYDAGAYGFIPDYARLDILYNEGGFYLDTDVELIGSIDDLRYQEAFCGVEKWQVVNFGGLSGAVREHPAVRRFLDARKELCFTDREGRQNRNTCGFYDTQTAIDMGYRINGQTQNIMGMNIYAYDFFQPFDYMSGTLNQTENTRSIHWFNGGWLDDDMREANRKTAERYKSLYNASKYL